MLHPSPASPAFSAALPADSVFRIWAGFPHSVTEQGLSSQGSRGQAWHTFGGILSCPHQGAQCALTPPLPYAWWDATWQSPLAEDVQELAAEGLEIGVRGLVGKRTIWAYCKRGNSTFVDTELT